MINLKKIVKTILIISMFFFLLGLLIIIINRNQVYPNEKEVIALEAFFGNKKIKRPKDIITIQNIIISEIKQIDSGKNTLDILQTIKKKKGLCYDRSLVLQKYFIIKGFKIRPVYLFWGKNNTSIFDFFKRKVSSHNVFEIYFNGYWYLIRTVHKMERLETLEEFLMRSKIVPIHCRYIRYLNNRNGNFLYPGYIPDVYFF